MRSPRIVSVFEKGDEKLKTACRGTGREIVSRRFLSKPSPRRRMGLLMRLCRGKFIGFAPDHILPLSLFLFPEDFSRKMENRKIENCSLGVYRGKGNECTSSRGKEGLDIDSKQKRLAGNGDRSIDRSIACIPFLATPIQPTVFTDGTLSGIT